ncbi:MAG: hypothetical protein J2P48_04910 [Alphaproteobacteria bacterium]|nr:hypothetical protein [Alphaproteobacteria bacterium]
MCGSERPTSRRPDLPAGVLVIPTDYRRGLEGVIVALVVFVWDIGKK